MVSDGSGWQLVVCVVLGQFSILLVVAPYMHFVASGCLFAEVLLELLTMGATIGVVGCVWQAMMHFGVLALFLKFKI